MNTNAMFDDYARLAGAMGTADLRVRWTELVDQRMSRPWTGTSVDGHVPFVDFSRASHALRCEFQQRGLYVWGAWTQTAARAQYIGISTKIGHRFGNRYIAGPVARARPTALHREINLAEAFTQNFRRLADDFSPLRTSVNVERYRVENIPIRTSQLTRLPRAERYAKIGLEHLWYFIIPAPSTESKRRLEAIEGALVKVANVELHASWSKGDKRSWPMLNVIHAQHATNPHVSGRDSTSYAEWVQGSWHRDDHASVPRMPSAERC